MRTIIKNIWKHEFFKPLHELVDVTHTYAFANYIFLKEFDANNSFNLHMLINRGLFVEVFFITRQKTSAR